MHQLDAAALLVGDTMKNAGLLLLGVGLGVYLLRRVSPPPLQDAARSAGSAIIHGAGDVAAGAIESVGEAVGIPRTNVDQCSADIAAGRTWDASFSCPASRFLRYLVN